MSPLTNPNIAARLIERASEHPSRVALIATRAGRRECVTFAELARRTTAFSDRLRARGVVADDRVLTFVPMSVDLYVALLGVLHAGAVAVFVDAWADRRRLNAAVLAAGPHAFLGIPRAHWLRLLSPATRRIPIAMVAWKGLGVSSPRADVDSTNDSPAAEVEPDTLALVTFTTGSTGRPKGAARSHAFLWAQHEILAAHLGQREGDVDMPTLPVFVLHNLAAGLTSVLPDFDPRRPAAIDPERILAQMRSESVTTSTGSPAFYERLCNYLRSTNATLPLRTFFTGGAPVAPSLARLFAECCASSQVLYGSTEAEPIAAVSSAELARRTDEGGGQGLCAGRPIAEIELRIIRASEEPITLGPSGWDDWSLDLGEPGEIVVRGPHVLRGYVENPEADRENKVHDGETIWHRTGDGGFLDAQGMLWLTGRVKHRVQRAGRTFWGLPVELRALAVRGIRHAAYVGLPDDSMGQHAVLFVEVEGAKLTPTLEREVLSAAAPSPVDEVIAVQRIPRDARHASKTDLDALLARYWPRRIASAP